MISQVLNKCYGFQAKTSSTTKYACERLDGSNAERAPISFGLYEIKLRQVRSWMFSRKWFSSSHTHIQTHADNPTGESLYGCCSRSDLAAEFSICFQFQVHMADCISGSRPGRDLKKTACFGACQHKGTWECEWVTGCVYKKERSQKRRRVCGFVCHRMFSKVFQQCMSDGRFLGKGKPKKKFPLWANHLWLQ